MMGDHQTESESSSVQQPSDLRRCLSLLEARAPNLFRSLLGPMPLDQVAEMRRFIRVLDPQAVNQIDNLSDDDLGHYYVRGNHLGVLMDYRVVLFMLMTAPLELVDDLNDMFGFRGEESEAILRPPDAIDAHYHLDRLASMIKGASFKSIRDVQAPADIPDDRRVNLLGGIANYCDPSRWPTFENLQGLEGLDKPCIGIHPKRCMKALPDDQMLQRLGEYAQSDLISGIGEVGVEQVDPQEYKTLDMQLRALTLILPTVLTGPKKVLVLHCRSKQDDDSREHFDHLTVLLDLTLQAAQVLQSQLIHFHCFTGSFASAQRWLERYPNTYFGFTRLARLSDAFEKLP